MLERRQIKTNEGGGGLKRMKEREADTAGRSTAERGGVNRGERGGTGSARRRRKLRGRSRHPTT